MNPDSATRVHLIPLGEWRACERGEQCPLPFHLSDMSAAEAEALPQHMLYPLLEVIDPPHSTGDDGEKRWYQPHSLRLHRESDLPAVIYPNGYMEWWYEGKLHREPGKPAIVYADGETEYWYHGRQAIKRSW